MTFIEGGDPARTRPVWVDEVPAAAPVDADADVLRRDMAALVRRYLDAAGTDDHRTQIVNLAGLLRHSAAHTVALTREIEYHATEASDAHTEVADLKATLDAVLLDNAGLQARIQELESSQREQSRGVS